MTPPELDPAVPSAAPDLVVHPHMAHWGACEVDVRDGAVVAVRPSPLDPDPSPLLGNVAGSVRHRSRVARPAVRRGWLERGPGADPSPARGADDFVEVSWDRALDLVAMELARVYRERGGAGVYGGSYGWASAGRFHHAQSQLHRFLNVMGGFVWGEHTYSNGALTVVMPHVVGSMRAYLDRATAWSTLERVARILMRRLISRRTAKGLSAEIRAGRPYRRGERRRPLNHGCRTRRRPPPSPRPRSIPTDDESRPRHASYAPVPIPDAHPGPHRDPTHPDP